MTQAAWDDAQHVGILWMLRLDEEALSARSALPAPGVTATLQRIGPEAVHQLAQAMELTDTAEVPARFARGCWCYAGRVEGEIASYGWVTFDEERIGELGLSIRLQADEAYIWDCATLPAYRGQGLYLALLAYISGELAAGGRRRIWIGANVDNTASQKTFARAGFQAVIDVGIRHAPTGDMMLVRHRPDIPEQDAIDAQRALLGHA